MDNGHLIIFDPGMSLLGKFVYGPLHPEPLGIKQPITWSAPDGWSSADMDYYAAQGNAHRIFFQKEFPIPGWKAITVNRYAEISYVASGGYSKPQLFPDFMYPFMKLVDRGFGIFPSIFATRLLVVLEKTSSS